VSPPCIWNVLSYKKFATLFIAVELFYGCAYLQLVRVNVQFMIMLIELCTVLCGTEFVQQNCIVLCGTEFVQQNCIHSSHEVRNFLSFRFPGQWIGRGSPHNWPVRSPDLSSLYYCVWGWMKELVYSVKVVTRDTVLGHILDAADQIINSKL
jgi:hypothetical protein